MADKAVLADNKLLSSFDQFVVPFSVLSVHSAIERVFVLTFKGTKQESTVLCL